MSWRPDSELERLLNALADETSNEADESRLAEILRHDAAARVHYRKFMALHSALLWDYAAAVPGDPGTPQESVALLMRAPGWRDIYALVAVLAALAAVAVFLFPGGGGAARTIVEIEEVVGSFSWTGPSGEVQGGLVAGRRLAAGNFLAADDTSAAVLRFLDGTRLTLGGGVDVLVADDGQKRVHLKSGTLSADVRPQPKGRPLIIRTSTATLEVVGTVLSVTAAPERTTMTVQQGHVRFERLADGEKVDVVQAHVVTASLEGNLPLLPKPTVMPPLAWTVDLARPANDGSRGDWFPAAKGAPALLKAVPLLVGRHHDAPLLHYGVSIRDYTQPNAGAFVSVVPTSTLRVRYRTTRAVSVLLFCITQRPGGAFGGNFELALPVDAGTPSADGWRTIDVPLADWRPLQPSRALHPAGNGISLLSVKTVSRDAGLEVAELSIVPRLPQ